MTYVSGYQCMTCGKIYPNDYQKNTCEACGETGILDVLYDYKSLKKIMTPSYFDENKDFSMWRYLPLISVDPQATKNMLHVGWTPLYDAHNLAKACGVKKVYIKDETINPSASLKDRASAVAVAKAIELKEPIICCSSTGNAASSLACHAAKAGLKSVIFVPSRAPIGKLTQMLAYGANVIRIDGDYKAAYNMSKIAIETFGFYNRNAAINPHLVEGKKTVALEIAEQMGFQVPDWVVVSVGDGCTIGGVYKGFYDLKALDLIDHIPKILGVQSDACSPFVDAFEKGEPLKEAQENTIADSIAVGIPRNPDKAIRAVQASHGSWIKVSDETIIQAIQEIASMEGIFGEPAGVASYAGLQKAIDKKLIKENDTVVVIVTGNGLKDISNAQKSITLPQALEPNKEKIIDYLSKENI